MPKNQDKKRKQDFGIFYTPQEVVNFIFEILKIWKDKEDTDTQRWQFRKPHAHFPSVIDPACGEGVFLKKAIDSGFTKPVYVWGVDLDEKVKEEWKKITLLKSFGSKANLDFHFYHQDGLLPIPEKRVGHKKGGMNQYDAVVGNPPYGGIGIGEITKELEKSLFEYEIWKRAVQKQSGAVVTQLGLIENSIKDRDKERLRNFPIEILFLDRFIQLAKPGGWIAIIIPDGILTNSNSHYVREFLSDRTKVEAIISLPRETFKNVGTNAKTSILFLRKLNEKEKPEQDYKVFLASAEKINQDNFDLIVKSYEKLYNLGESNMNKSDSIQITKDQTSKEVVFARTDKTIKQLMEERPSSRWNPEYWKPIYEENIQTLLKGKHPVIPLGKYIPEGPEGITYGQVGTRLLSKDGEVQYLQVINITPTGIDILIKDDKIKESTVNDPKRSRLRRNDLLLVNQGVGSLGKSAVFLEKGKFNISQHIDVIRLLGISSFYVCIFLQTSFGKLQMERFNSGVSGQINITFDQIKSVLIPELNIDNQKKLESKYLDMYGYHCKAIEAKRGGNNSEYKKI